jgi:hypothetical protein
MRDGFHPTLRWSFTMISFSITLPTENTSNVSVGKKLFVCRLFSPSPKLWLLARSIARAHTQRDIYIYTHTAVLKCNKVQLLQEMHKPFTPPCVPHVACREGIFFVSDRKNAISPEPLLRFLIRLHQVVWKNVLNKTRSMKTIFGELFFKYVIATWMYYELPSWVQHSCNFSVA